MDVLAQVSRKTSQVKNSGGEKKANPVSGTEQKLWTNNIMTTYIQSDQS